MTLGHPLSESEKLEIEPLELIVTSAAAITGVFATYVLLLHWGNPLDIPVVSLILQPYVLFCVVTISTIQRRRFGTVGRSRMLSSLFAFIVASLSWLYLLILDANVTIQDSTTLALSNVIVALGALAYLSKSGRGQDTFRFVCIATWALGFYLIPTWNMLKSFSAPSFNLAVLNTGILIFCPLYLLAGFHTIFALRESRE